MKNLRIPAVLMAYTACAVLLLPASALGAVYAVLMACLLLSLLPVLVETLATTESTDGSLQ